MDTETKIKCPIVYGCATEPMIQGNDSSEMLDYVYSLVINTFDTAENYGCSVSEIAIAWLLNQNSLAVYPILGTTRKENIEKKLGALKIKPSREEIEWIRG